uniref:Uncharacterized protein n=2 Tax=Panagrolaimus TaxID=55784 RepID=A0A914Q3V2_9BILA
MNKILIACLLVVLVFALSTEAQFYGGGYPGGFYGGRGFRGGFGGGYPGGFYGGYPGGYGGYGFRRRFWGGPFYG